MVYVKFYNDAGEIVLVPVKESDPVPVPSSWKPAETYEQARKRNYRGPGHNRLVGSVLLFGRG